MWRRLILGLIVACVVASALPATQAASQQKSVSEQLVGAWAFVSSNAKLPDGSPLWGSDPKD